MNIAKKSVVAALLTAGLAAAGSPLPPPPLVSAAGGQSWSVVGARTVGQGRSALEGSLGWPGLHLSFLHGQSPALDIGARVTFNLGVEGAVVNPVPGLKAQFLVHYKLLEDQQVSLQLQFEPGPLFYFYNPVCFNCSSRTQSGFILPVGLRMGIAATSALNVGLAFEVPLWIAFGSTNVVHVPILVGGGVDYFLKTNLLIYLLLRLGPSLSSAPGGQLVSFVFDGQAGIGYRF